MIEYHLVRSRRKTLSLQVKQGRVFVRAPLHIDEQYIKTFIEKKQAWLNAKITQQNQATDLSCNFNQGDQLLLLGQWVTLNIHWTDCAQRTCNKENVFLTSGSSNQQILNVNMPRTSNNASQLEEVKKQLEGYLKQQAQVIILPKVAQYAQLTQLSPVSVKIRQYRARWGSCNNRGELSFNYLLMMLPLAVIDYVIVHELCHLQHLNHSASFWQLVAKYFPDYQEAKHWIKLNHSALQWRLPV